MGRASTAAAVTLMLVVVASCGAGVTVVSFDAPVPPEVVGAMYDTIKGRMSTATA